MNQPIRPANFDEAYPGRFLKAGSFKGKKVTLTISDVTKEELEGDKGTESKVIVYFEKTPRQLVLCKLNALCIKSMFGPNCPEWRGRKVTFFPTAEIAPMRKGEECIRVWGSPELSEDITVPIKLPKRREFSITLHKDDKQ